MMRERLKLIIFFLVPLLIFYFSQELLAHVFGNISWQLQITNVVFFEAVALFLVGLTGRPRLSLWTEAIIFWLFALANSFVYQFRGSYIMIWDFISIPTAVNVASNYSYSLTQRAIVCSVLFLGLLVLIWFVRPDVKQFLNRLWKRALTCALGIGLIIGIYNLIHVPAVEEAFDIHDSKFSIEHVTEMNGMMIGFLYKIKYMSVHVPEGYSRWDMKELIENTEVEGKAPDELPDIIVIMDEAFSDLGVDYPIETNEDYMPFVHYLQQNAENTISGYMNASVIGGKTPNTEFEFLTGNTLAFLPEDSIPFQQFLKKKIDAMPWYLSSLGYDTIGMHPYLSSGWDRTVAYPLMGFQKVHFEDYFDLSPKNLVREYMSDAAFFEQIKKELVNRENPDKPMFSFNVTMQNHSGYDGKYDNFKPSISVNAADDSYPEALWKLTNYLSLIRLSDAAFEDLVEYYKGVDKKTILVLFGDHQPPPGLLNPVRTGDEELRAEEGVNIRRVPFIIWANYDIQEKAGIETSANYLGNLVLEAAGIPLTRYRTQLKSFSERFPVLSATRSVDADGKTRQMDGTDPIYGDYAKLQYYELFDDNDEYY